MSSEYKHERLETLQRNYRRAWAVYTAEVECMQSGGESVRERVEKAASEYRMARDEMALFLLETVREPELAGCRTA